MLAILFSPYHVNGLCLYHPENIRKPVGGGGGGGYGKRPVARNGLIGNFI